MNKTDKKLIKENLILRAKLIILRNFMLKTVPDDNQRKQIEFTINNIESSAEIIVEDFLMKIHSIEKDENWEVILESLMKDIKI